MYKLKCLNFPTNNYNLQEGNFVYQNCVKHQFIVTLLIPVSLLIDYNFPLKFRFNEIIYNIILFLGPKIEGKNNSILFFLSFTLKYNPYVKTLKLNLKLLYQMREINSNDIDLCMIGLPYRDLKG